MTLISLMTLIIKTVLKIFKHETANRNRFRAVSALYKRPTKLIVTGNRSKNKIIRILSF